MGISVFDAMLRHPGEALNKFDPFRGEPFLRMVDPLPSGSRFMTTEEARPGWRALLVFSLMTVPTVLFAMLQPMHGFDRIRGDAAGRGGIFHDIDFATMCVVWASYIAIILYGRRLIGALLLTLEKTHVVASRPRGKWSLTPHSRVLGLLERLSRLTTRRAVIWMGIFIFFNIMAQREGLGGHIQTWRTDPLTLGSLLHVFHLGLKQLNLAGTWHQCIASALSGYLMLLVARLYVMFACLSEVISCDPSLRIVPPHPDGVGGLLPVGESALFMSLAIFSSGLGITAIAIRLLLENGSIAFDFILFLVGPYLILGPLLFFLPLASLRRVMIDAKYKYLLLADRLYYTVQAQHLQGLEANQFDASSLQGQTSLALLIEAASKMAVWPFDVRTLRRFFTILISPLLPVILKGVSPFLKDVPVLNEIIGRLIGP